MIALQVPAAWQYGMALAQFVATCACCLVLDAMAPGSLPPASAIIPHSLAGLLASWAVTRANAVADAAQPAAAAAAAACAPGKAPAQAAAASKPLVQLHPAHPLLLQQPQQPGASTVIRTTTTHCSTALIAPDGAAPTLLPLPDDEHAGPVVPVPAQAAGAAGAAAGGPAEQALLAQLMPQPRAARPAAGACLRYASRAPRHRVCFKLHYADPEDLPSGWLQVGCDGPAGCGFATGAGGALAGHAVRRRMARPMSCPTHSRVWPGTEPRLML